MVGQTEMESVADCPPGLVAEEAIRSSSPAAAGDDARVHEQRERSNTNVLVYEMCLKSRTREREEGEKQLGGGYAASRLLVRAGE